MIPRFRFAGLLLCIALVTVGGLCSCQISQGQSPTLAIRDEGPPRERVLAFRVAFNQLAEKNRLRPLEAIKLRRVANDEALCEYLAMKYGSEANIETATGDQFMKWIEWIIANQDSIIKFVTTLIDMFSQTGERTWQISQAAIYRGGVALHLVRTRSRGFDERFRWRVNC